MKSANGLFEAVASPPHSKSVWATSCPILGNQLIQELLSLGCHQQDIGDAMSEIDPNWVSNLDLNVSSNRS
jgi:hypothetical protein